MEDSHHIAHGETQVLQQRKNQQATRKNRSSPPRTVLPPAILHPRCRVRRIVGSGSLFPESIFLLAALWIRRSLRKSLKRQEFAQDRKVAEQLGTQQVSQSLEKIWNLDQRQMRTNFRYSFLAGWMAYWNPSIKQRIEELSKPRPVDLLRPSRIPRIGLRGRVITVLVGFAIFWGSGLVAGNIYARGQTMVVCMDTTCSALVVIAAVGFWMAILGGISIIVWILRRFL